MLAIVLKILSILGMILLTLLCAAMTILLLVLFFPISYRIKGRKDTEELAVCARAGWLFGLLRVQYSYPQPGRPVIKILCFQLKQRQRKTGDLDSSERAQTSEAQKAKEPERENVNAKEDESGKVNEISAKSEQQTQKQSFLERIFAKISKIKYTILKLCAKIKHIWQNITFYQRLLTEENTRELFRHACLRVGRILKSIRPRKLRADIRFGAASPDTTGYLYGMYGMLSPKLGKNICVIPDFEQAVLEGEIDTAGHITVFRILWNGILLVLDKRLRKFLRRLRMREAAQQ